MKFDYGHVKLTLDSTIRILFRIAGERPRQQTELHTLRNDLRSVHAKMISCGCACLTAIATMMPWHFCFVAMPSGGKFEVTAGGAGHPGHDAVFQVAVVDHCTC